jgi:exodeoxyribonuclease VII large subunit
MIAAMSRYIEYKQLLLKHALQKMASPAQLISTHWQTLDYLERHLQHALRQRIMQCKHRLHLQITLLHARHPHLLLQQMKDKVQCLEAVLLQAIFTYIDKIRQRLTQLSTTLHAVSPLATLNRGYAIVTHHKQCVLNSQQVKLSDQVAIRLANGSLTCEVINIDE